MNLIYVKNIGKFIKIKQNNLFLKYEKNSIDFDFEPYREGKKIIVNIPTLFSANTSLSYFNWDFNNDGIIEASSQTAEYLFVSALQNNIKLNNKQNIVRSVYSDYLMKKQVLGGSHNKCIVYIDRNGDFYCCGESINSQLGFSGTTEKVFIKNPAFLDTFKSVMANIYATAIIKNDGTLWTAGTANYNGTDQTRNSFQQLGTKNDWNRFVRGASNNAMALLDNSGDLYLITNSLTKVNVPFKWKDVAIGGLYYCIIGIAEDNTLWGFGSNEYGMLGLNHNNFVVTPTQIGTDNDWKAVFGGYVAQQFLALKNDGTLWGSGRNVAAQSGYGDRNTFGLIAGGFNDWVTASTGRGNAIAIRKNGNVYVWGLNTYGELGLGHTDRVTSVTLNNNIKSPLLVYRADGCTIALARKSNPLTEVSSKAVFGYRFGIGHSSGNGYGGTTGSNLPIRVNIIRNYNYIDFRRLYNIFKDKVAPGGFHTFLIKENGTLWVTGNNNRGQLGLGDNLNRSSFVQLGSSSDWSKVATATVDSSVVLRNDGKLYGCGYSESNGYSTTTDIDTLQQIITSHSDFVDVKGGYNFYVALRSNGELWSWGNSNAGQLGRGVISNSAFLPDIVINNVVKYSVGATHVAAIRTDGTLWVWGNGFNGRLGTGNTNNQSIPVQVGTANDWVKVCAGNDSTYVMNSSGQWFGTGNNILTSPGVVTNNVLTFTPIALPYNDFFDIYPLGGGSFGVRRNGKIYWWGSSPQNYNGRMIGSGQFRESQELHFLYCFYKGSSGILNNFALRSSGDFCACGYNGTGGFGNGNLVNSNVFVNSNISYFY